MAEIIRFPKEEARRVEIANDDSADAINQGHVIRLDLIVKPTLARQIMELVAAAPIT